MEKTSERTATECRRRATTSQSVEHAAIGNVAEAGGLLAQDIQDRAAQAVEHLSTAVDDTAPCRQATSRFADENHRNVLLTVIAASLFVGPHDQRVVEHGAVALRNGVELGGEPRHPAGVILVHQYDARCVLRRAAGVPRIEMRDLVMTVQVDSLPGKPPLASAVTELHGRDARQSALERQRRQ